MPLMTNAEAFRYDFGIYATELWAMPEEQFLEWLNAWCDRERPADMVVWCKDCKYSETAGLNIVAKGVGLLEERRIRFCKYELPTPIVADMHFCSWGEREDNAVK